MGQGLIANPGGVHWDWGQTDSQCIEPGRRGNERCKVHGLGPTEVVGKHHQRVVFGHKPADAGGTAALQPTFGQCGAQCKIHKNILKMGTQSWDDRQQLGTRFTA